MTSTALTTSLAYALSGAAERAALAAERQLGRGDETAADRASAAAMRQALDTVPMSGHIVVGPGEEGTESPLRLGDAIGASKAPSLDIALDPLEGSTLTAKAMPNAIAVIAATESGGLMRVPNIYMEKLAIGPGYAEGVVDLDAPPGENARRLAEAKGVDVGDITVCVLDRPRHDRIIADLRRVGARIKLISEGDVAGVINAAIPAVGIDMYLGQGGAPEGVLAAAALRCVGGQFQCRLVVRTDADRFKADKTGIRDFSRRYSICDLVKGEAIFAATGVTNGTLLSGVRRTREQARTESLVLTSFDGAVRRVSTTAPV